MKEQTVYALGFFDGVHLGHQALLRECRRLADQAQCQAGVVTFRTHPAKLLRGKEPPRVNTGTDRRDLLLSYGIDIVEERPFDKVTMETPWEAFMVKFLCPAGFVCGSDFRFGKGGEGTAEKLAQWCKEQNIPCVIVPQQELDGIRVSSTHIRSLLEQGNMAEAVRFLGHPHRMTGTVIHGKNLGHKLGIPTANMKLPEGTVQLPKGVYACTAEVDGRIYPAVTNIGTQPTVDGNALTVEPWILDFEGDLYGKKLTLHFYDYLRPEQKFDSVEELKAEIQKNAAQAQKILEKY
ncbi:MAG: bifunctional riboflavin kinase/FAD synthetase [Oscillospiraceae bacterium]|nr:bifunctional riboflavin kinase/FAD synthetase [Oscillospiraceae bacterium]MBQ8797753.1 bifunctional riboflavin kinase/FAD synthetase [Oscillospiraceae bacterium]